MRTVLKVKYHDIKLPKINKIQQGDWVDLCAAEDVAMEAGDFKLISLGISVKMPHTYEMHIVPRSSTFKHFGILQTNHMGIIDNSYCGDEDVIKFPALAMRDTEIKFGDRICQFRLVQNQKKLSIVEVETLGSKSRGGFGSTGKSTPCCR